MNIPQILKELKMKVLMMVATAVIEAVNDSTKIQQNQVSILEGEVHSGYDRVQEYGFSSVPNPGCQAVVACVGGSRDHGLVIATEDVRYRPTGLLPGESVMYNDKGSYAKFKSDGTLEIVAPTVTMSGNVYIDGDVFVKGDIRDKSDTNTENMRNMREIYDSHTHAETGSTTAVPSQLMG